jgi:catechol 2,3-dioxygenase-like lactoylglutathione lyase family enzyme
MSFAQIHAISDVCVLCSDVETSTRFYADKLGFALLHRAPGFADFSGAGLTLALWERGHIHENTGVARADSSTGMCVAVKLPDPATLDTIYAELLTKGVPFVGPPADYPWNAYAAYFTGPDGEVWEIYTWRQGGAIGAVDQP